ncbi:hypothetical protein PENTCL1PPCAC_29480, partial [Pristionchus entomophagus]
QAEKDAAEKKAAEEQAAKEAAVAAAAAAEQEAVDAAASKAALEAEAIPAKDADVEEVFELKREVNQFAENDEGKKGGKKNKKSKKNSESETANGQTVIEDVQEKAYEQTVIPTEESAPAAEAESKKSKKNKKGGTTEEPKAETASNGHNAVEEIDYATKVEAPVANGDDHQFIEPASKGGKKSNKKNKGKDHEDHEEAPIAQVSPPLQVNEITSTAEENITVLHAQKEIEKPTQFAQEVEKLVSETLKAKYPEISVTDDTMKMTIDAQLLKLAEQPKQPLIEHKPIVLACDRLVLSRPSTPSRDRLYKLLPKDIIFCSTLIDKYGDNFNAMAADESNVYRESARGLQRKIRIFKESPHFTAYNAAKAEGKTVAQWLEENPE